MVHVRFLSAFIASVALFLLAGCTGDTYLTGPDLLDDEEDLFEEFDGATLQVYSPLPAEIVFLEDGIALDAEIISADGEVMEFEDIVWETDTEFEPIHVGTYTEMDLDWGIHTFTVTAELPNGDRLQTLIGGVRIQGRHTGVYSGNFAINIDIEFQGTPITASCLGGLDFVVDMSGENIHGEDGQCTINLFIMGEMDVNYGVEGAIDDQTAEGDIQINLGLFDVPVGFDGEIDDGQMFTDFEGNIVLFAFTGAIDAHRVSIYVEE